MANFEELNQANPEFLAAAQERASEIIELGLGVIELTETILGAPLPEPTEKRDETILPTESVITPARNKAIRAALTEIGIGLLADRGLFEAGLGQDAVVLIEGGQRHKVVAETALIGTGPVIFSGSRHRPIAGTEREVTANIFELSDDEIGASEFDMITHVGTHLDGFEPLEQPHEVGRLIVTGDLVYDDEEQGPRTEQDDKYGSLVQIGTTKGGLQPVHVFGVPRKYLFDAEGRPILNAKGEQKYIQPTAGQQALAFTRLLGYQEGAVATSSTYYPSRLGEIVRASFHALRRGQPAPKIEIVAYCPATLAKVKREETAAAIPIMGNILGEAYAARKTFLALQAEIANP